MRKAAFCRCSWRDGDDRPALQRHPWELADIWAELHAQLVLGKAMFPQATHVSAHMVRHFAGFDTRVGAVVTDLCRQFDLGDDPFAHGIPRFGGYPKQPCEAAFRTSAFVDGLNGLSAGTHIFIDHPVVPSPDFVAVGHVGYENVGQDRTSCLQVLTDAAVASAVDTLGIEVISCAQALSEA